MLLEEGSNSEIGSIEEFFSDEHLKQLKSIMSIVTAKKGTYLYWEGEELTHLYYIYSGLIKVEKTTVEGKKLNLSIHHAGDLVGEYGSSQHVFSAKVMEETKVGLLKIKDLEELIAASGDLALQFCKWMGYSQRLAQLKIRDLLLHGKTGALASILIRLSNTYGVKHAHGIMLDIHLTNTEMAEFLGMSRESVNRLLNHWKQAGIIDLNNGKIFINSLSALRNISQCPTQPTCPLELCRL